MTEGCSDWLTQERELTGSARSWSGRPGSVWSRLWSPPGPPGLTRPAAPCGPQPVTPVSSLGRGTQNFSSRFQQKSRGCQHRPSDAICHGELHSGPRAGQCFTLTWRPWAPLGLSRAPPRLTCCGAGRKAHGKFGVCEQPRSACFPRSHGLPPGPACAQSAPGDPLIQQCSPRSSPGSTCGFPDKQAVLTSEAAPGHLSPGCWLRLVLLDGDAQEGVDPDPGPETPHLQQPPGEGESRWLLQPTNQKDPTALSPQRPERTSRAGAGAQSQRPSASGRQVAPSGPRVPTLHLPTRGPPRPGHPPSPAPDCPARRWGAGAPPGLCTGTR